MFYSSPYISKLDRTFVLETLLRLIGPVFWTLVVVKQLFGMPIFFSPIAPKVKFSSFSVGMASSLSFAISTTRPTFLSFSPIQTFETIILKNFFDRFFWSRREWAAASTSWRARTRTRTRWSCSRFRNASEPWRRLWRSLRWVSDRPSGSFLSKYELKLSKA